MGQCNAIKILDFSGDWDKLQKKLFTQTIADKTYETIQKIKQNH